MSDQLDSKRFPRASAYMARLPAGLSSYPECRVRADVFADLPALLAPRCDSLVLPAPLERFVRGERQEDWMPETLACTALLMVRDELHVSDASFFEWDYGRNIRLFSRPLNRIIMAVISSTLLVMGAAKRWGSFHQGTSLTPTPVSRNADRLSTIVELSFPDHLFDETLVRIFSGAYRAALDFVKARGVELKVSSVEPARAVFTVSWLA